MLRFEPVAQLETGLSLRPFMKSAPVASRNLFFDIQVVTLLLGEYTLFASANLCYPTTKLHSYFSTVFAAHLRVYTRTAGCNRGLREA